MEATRESDKLRATCEKLQGELERQARLIRETQVGEVQAQAAERVRVAGTGWMGSCEKAGFFTSVRLRPGLRWQR